MMDNLLWEVVLECGQIHTDDNKEMPGEPVLVWIWAAWLAGADSTERISYPRQNNGTRKLTFLSCRCSCCLTVLSYFLAPIHHTVDWLIFSPFQFL